MKILVSVKFVFVFRTVRHIQISEEISENQSAKLAKLAKTARTKLAKLAN